MALAGVLTIHDEETTILRALDSFSKVCDPIIGLDVGCTDGAVELARDFGVEMHEQEWTTFGNANETLLRLARDRADHVLFCSATETVEQDGELPAFDAPVYLVPCWKHGVMFHNERLFDTAIDWTCVGPVHSPIQPAFFEERRELPELVITQHDDDGRRPEKLERYRRELEAWVTEHPRDTRSLYYLALTYYHLGSAHTAAGLYRRRATMSEGDVEQWHSVYMAGVCELGFDFPAAAELFAEAMRLRPDRMEPLYTLEAACHAIREQHVPPTGLDVLFVNPDAYLGAET